ncbi:MAG: alpha-amylase [Kouleothrix sp.]|nr:alpha-amylase [Kouleothrix sp.]
MLTDRTAGIPTMEFHVARDARDRYRFDDSLYSISGDVILANFHAARVFAQRMNQKRDLVNFPEQAVKASQINAMGLIHELTHYMFRIYREQHNPRMLEEALGWLGSQVGPAAVDTALKKFVDEFPPLAIYKRDADSATYLAGQTGGMPNREVVLEELLMLWLENANPAFAPFLELFDDKRLEKETPYPGVISSLHQFFGSAAVSAGEGGGAAGTIAGIFGRQNLLDVLRAPAQASPHSLEGQLEFIRERWGLSLGKFFYRLLGGLDLIKEENKPVFFGPGPVEVPVYGFGGLDAEPERFSPDKDWMPRLVLMAKNAYVWLDQLSKTYARPIATLDQVPDEELDKLARWGVSGLWLIGLWERSAASQRIKQIMGNPDAVASAYSLFDYQIAGKLGGEPACQNLRERAWQRGIRLASDMVPNHVGIDGKWVIEHPDWFISVDQSPYPAYSFSGPDLSWDQGVGIFLEDHYYTRSDAAVVFKRVSYGSGEERYIYHGNDGTSMPWNDTAQLDYLKAEVREAVIQLILHVARQFPVIRFDAAMTLAKKHIQRLWFPEPGSGGAIPSRSEHALTKAEFEALIPNEFWREVVDRVAAEVPDTLLLAEAFWLMEGYFVRTLGMHRVYNSAFMHMMRDEDNAKYRYLIKQTLEFDPEILKRYVNFQNNPDERTAVEQFGKGDKYFGICTVMLTLPGLPMLGHGQIEGFSEKYGMEYQRAYWDEKADQYLVERHEREIFPLAHKRYLFAGVESFLLYDFFTPDGGVAEDVFAYSNRYGDERSLVVYHNKYASVRGWVRSSVAFLVKSDDGEERKLVQRTLGEGLELSGDEATFYIFRDHTGGLEYIRSGRELVEQGLYVELGAYKCDVFIDWREVRDDALNQYSHLANFLAGRGVPSIDEALKEIFLQPIHYAFKELVNADLFRRLIDAVATEDQSPTANDQAVATEDQRPTTNDQSPGVQDEIVAEDGADDAEDLVLGPSSSVVAALLDEVEQKVLNLLQEIKQFTESPGEAAPIAREVRDEVAAILELPTMDQRFADDAPVAAAIGAASARLDHNTALWGSLFGWALIHPLGKLTGAADYAEQSRSWIDEWLLGRIIAGALRDIGLDEQAAAQAITVIKHLTSHQDWFQAPGMAQVSRLLGTLLADREVQQLLRVNRYQGVLWFDKDAFERLLQWMLLLAVVSISADHTQAQAEAVVILDAAYGTVTQLRDAAAQSGYQVEKLLALAQG